MKCASVIFVASFFGLPSLAFGQGFVNLDFEATSVPNGTTPGSLLTTNQAIPGWVAYVGGSEVNQIVYNTRPLDAAEVTLQGPSSGTLTPIEGNYTVELFGASAFAPQQSAAIGQTGQIPLSAQSLIFWGYSTDVSFNGQDLSLVLLGSTANYNIYGADVSGFAGQTGELLFTAQPQTLDVLDNIQFSPSQIPEPGEFALLALGALSLGFWHRRKSVR